MTFYKPHTTFKQLALEAKEASYDLMEFCDGEFTIEEIKIWLFKYSGLDDEINEIAKHERRYREEEIFFSYPEIKRIYFLYRGIKQFEAIHEQQNMIEKANGEAENLNVDANNNEDKNEILDWVIKWECLKRPIEISPCSEGSDNPEKIIFIFNEAPDIQLNMAPFVFKQYLKFKKQFNYFEEKLMQESFN